MVISNSWLQRLRNQLIASERKSPLPVSPPPQAKETSASEKIKCLKKLIHQPWAKPEAVFAQIVEITFSDSWLQIESNKRRVTDFRNNEQQQALIINDLYVKPLLDQSERLSLDNNQVVLKKDSEKKDPENKDILLLEMVIKVNSTNKASKLPIFYKEKLEISINPDNKIPES
jgi:hypothetical protein